MAGPIEVDLEEAEQCKAINMIKYLFAFCSSDDSKDVPVCDEELLERNFEEVRKIANRDDTTLSMELSEL